jgi:hypothetical protein
METLRDVATIAGITAAIINLLFWLFWEVSWLSTAYPWLQLVPTAIAFVLTGAVQIVRTWRVTTRTLPTGGPDLFRGRWSDVILPGWCKLVMVVGLPMMLFGGFVGLAGLCLVSGAAAQYRWKVYEE